MPLSGMALCEAEMTTPRSAPSVAGEERDRRGRQHAEQHARRRRPRPGRPRPRPPASRRWPVGSRPSDGQRPPAPRRRPAGAMAPDRRPGATGGPPPAPGSRTPAPGRPHVARRSASSGVRSALARPRTPSVPNSRPTAASALRVLGCLAGLLQAVLLALVGAGVAGEEAGLLQRRDDRSRPAR